MIVMIGLYIKSGQNAQRRNGALLLRCVVGSKFPASCVDINLAEPGLELASFFLA